MWLVVSLSLGQRPLGKKLVIESNHQDIYIFKSFQCFQNFVAISQRYCQQLLTLVGGCKGDTVGRFLIAL